MRTRPLSWVSAFLVCLLSISVSAQTKPTPATKTPSPAFEYWSTGEVTPAPTTTSTPAAATATVPSAAANAKTRAGLLLVGGGTNVPDAWRWFTTCAGGGHILILSASGEDSFQNSVFKKLGGVRSIETIQFNNATASSDKFVLERIAQADGIFLAGGKQSLYVPYWQNTPVATALNAHLAAGKPLGGTSAGLAILGEYYFSALKKSATSPTVLANPFDNSITLGDNFINAPQMRGILTDTHFMARDRLGRLVGFMARLQTRPATTLRAGLGIDEGTALCVEPDGKARLFTVKDGSAWLIRPFESTQLRAGQPLTTQPIELTAIGPKSVVNLKTLTVESSLSVQRIQITDGKIAVLSEGRFKLSPAKGTSEAADAKPAPEVD